VIAKAPVPPLEKAWEFKADSYVKDPSSLLAAHDMVFFGSNNGLIYALDAMSGTPRWTFKMGKALKLPLVSANGILFAASEDRNFYAIDAQRGEKRWQFSIGKDFLEWKYPGDVYYGPVVADGVVYIATKDKKLYALDVHTGKERWLFSAGGEISPPAVSHEVVFFGSKDKRVYALDVNSGKKLWEAKTGHEKHSCPIIVDGKMVITGDDDLYALNPNNGAILWEVKKVLHKQVLPAVVGGYAFCSKGLDVIDLASGKKVETIPAPLNDFSKVVAVEGTLYAMALPKGMSTPHCAEFLFAYDVATRKEKWQACLNAAVHLWEISDGFIFVVDSWHRKLIALNTLKVTKRWEYKFPWGIGKTLIAFGMVFVNWADVVYAFRSSRDLAAQRSLEISNEISPSPKYEVETVREPIIWPNCCCLCCGPAEVHIDLKKEFKLGGFWMGTVEAKDIPYCKECHKKITKMIGARTSAGVEIIRSPPTYAFRNEKYWAMFMETNRLR